MSRSMLITKVSVRDASKDMPGLFLFALMGGMSVGAYYLGAHVAEEKIIDPQFLLGSGAKNDGTYPMALVFIAAAMALCIYGKAIFNRVREARAGHDPAAAPIVNGEGGKIEVVRKDGASYWSARNWLFLHAPRLTLNLAVLVLMAAAPWVHIAMNDDIRLDYNDPDAGEAAAGKAGQGLFIGISILMFLVSSFVIPVINNQEYVRAKGKESSPGLFGWQDDLFVNQADEFIATSGAPALGLI